VRSRASGCPSANAALAVISETTKPAPSRAAARRKGASVTPDMGASNTRFGSTMLPIDTGVRRKLWLGETT
jgi:hypothetical protein